MRGILALLGSGEFTISMVNMDKYLLDKTHKPRIAILPTAAGKEAAFDSWIKKGISYYKKLGFDAKGIEIKNEGDANSVEIAESLEKFNYYVFSGGDPGHLLESMENSLAWAVIKNKFNLGATMVGSSAGAMVMGSKVWDSIYEFDKKNVVRPWSKGLEMVDFSVLPHFNTIPNYFPHDKIKVMVSNFPTDRVVGIDEDTAYINENQKWITLGSGKVTTDALNYYEKIT